jgi:class 3 adenylate cyclase
LRHLAGILAADVTGYSRLMGRNEEETVRDLEAHHAAMLPLIAKHGGAIINIAGDGIVAQFPSGVLAVECAVAIQRSWLSAISTFSPNVGCCFALASILAALSMMEPAPTVKESV